MTKGLRPAGQPVQQLRTEKLCISSFTLASATELAHLRPTGAEKLQLRIIASLVVFVGSYFPLSLILLAQDFRYELLSANFCWPIEADKCVVPFRNWTLSIPAFAICLVCLIFSFGVLKTVKPKIPVDVKEAKYIPAELMA